ncbi:MAG: aspartate aminotransferase family protein, partial [Methyloligellaceae bacterium]
APMRPGNFPQAAPDSSGIPQSLRDEMLVAPYNDAETATGLIGQYRDELAGVIVEPQQRIIPPKPGFLEALREATRAHDIPLIFDEVVTGFRHAYGGGQAYYGVTPDLCALGKVIGGGFPLAAIAGRDDIMAHFDMAAVGTDEFVKMIGTLSGNPVAATAGLATLDILRRPDTYEQLFATGRELMEGLRRLLDGAGLPAQVVGEPPMFDVVFTDQEVTDYRSCVAGDQEMLSRFTALLKEHGVLKGEAKFYVSTAHDGKDVEQTLDACAHAIDALADRRH